MKIRLIGQRNEQGIGNHYACFSDALKQIRGIGHLVEEIDAQDPIALDRAVGRSQPNDVNISFVAMNIHEYFRGHNVQWVVFESTFLPKKVDWVVKAADQVWVPSAWGRDMLIQNSIAADRVHVVPEGIMGNMFHSYGRQPHNNDRPFRFLTVGKYEERKSIDETLQAFAQVYGNVPGVELVIKSNYFVNADQKAAVLQNKIQSLGLKNVVVVWGSVDYEEIADLYRNADVFVLPTKGEGWGIPLIEAAASGIPIITVSYSGHTEFLRRIPDSGIPVDYVMAPITCPEYQFYYPDPDGNYGEWARPDIYSLSNALKLAKKNYEQLYKNAQKNSQIIRSEFGWAQSVEKALAAMASAGWI
jgi:glycosyltransferase involved in cell wall biosynthesis